MDNLQYTWSHGPVYVSVFVYIVVTFYLDSLLPIGSKLMLNQFQDAFWY